MKKRIVKEAMAKVEAAVEQVIEQGDIVQEEAMFDAHEAALDGRSKKFLADIISGKVEGPYKPRSGWRTR